MNFPENMNNGTIIEQSQRYYIYFVLCFELNLNNNLIHRSNDERYGVLALDVQGQSGETEDEDVQIPAERTDLNKPLNSQQK